MKVPTLNNQPKYTAAPEVPPFLKILDPSETMDLDALGTPSEIEYVSPQQFLRRIPGDGKPWGLNNLLRFGKELSFAADGLGLPIQRVYDPKLGPARVYPIELVRAIYRQYHAVYGWPALVEVVELAETQSAAPATEGAQEEMAAPGDAAVREAMTKHLEMLAEAAQEETVRASARVLLARLG